MIPVCVLCYSLNLLRYEYPGLLFTHGLLDFKHYGILSSILPFAVIAISKLIIGHQAISLAKLRRIGNVLLASFCLVVG
jgi:hypothetical protein